MKITINDEKRKTTIDLTKFQVHYLETICQAYNYSIDELIRLLIFSEKTNSLYEKSIEYLNSIEKLDDNKNN